MLTKKINTTAFLITLITVLIVYNYIIICKLLHLFK